MPRRPSVLAVGVLAPLLLGALAACGGEPEPVEALPPLAPVDLCALLPEAATQGLSDSASSSEEGSPTAACALRSGAGDTVLVTWLQLGDEAEARSAYESQCAAIDRTVLPEQQVSVEGADETCAGAAPADEDPRASLVALYEQEVITVRASTTATGPAPLQRSASLAASVVAELPRPE